MNYHNKTIVSLLLICTMILANISILKNLIFSVISFASLIKACGGLVGVYIVNYLLSDTQLSIMSEYDKFWIDNNCYFLLMTLISFFLILEMSNVEFGILSYIFIIFYIIGVNYLCIEYSALISGVFIVFMMYLYDSSKNVVKIFEDNVTFDISDVFLEKTDDFVICKDTDGEVYLICNDGTRLNIGADENGSIHINDNLNNVIITTCETMNNNMFTNHVSEVHILFNNKYNILKEYNIFTEIDNIINSFNVEFTPQLNTYNQKSEFYLKNLYNIDGKLCETYLLYKNSLIGQVNELNEMLINIDASFVDSHGIRRFVFDIRDDDLYIWDNGKYKKCDYSLQDLHNNKICFVSQSKGELVDIYTSKLHACGKYDCQFDYCIFDEHSGFVYYRNSNYRICHESIGHVMDYCGQKVCVFGASKIKVNENQEVSYDKVKLNLNMAYAIDEQRCDGRYLLCKNLTCRLLSGNVPYVNCYFNTREKLKFIQNDTNDACIGGFSPANNNRLTKDVIAIYEPCGFVNILENQVYYRFNDVMCLLGSLTDLRDNGIYVITIDGNIVYYYDCNGEKHEFSNMSVNSPIDTLNEVFYRDIFINI